MTAYRLMAADDRDFVVSSWSSSFRTSRYAGFLAMTTYADTMHREIDTILARPSTEVTVAYEPGEMVETPRGPREFVYGWIATRTDLRVPYVYYVFVKVAYRRGRERLGLEHGHATALFAAAGIDPNERFLYAYPTAISEQIEYARKIPLAEQKPLPARFERPQ